VTQLLYEELSDTILGAAVEVHKVLGPGFLESVYQRALAHELGLKHVAFKTKVPLPVQYKDLTIGEYEADLVVEDRIIVELKAASLLVAAHIAQAHHYLAATGLRVALLLNFGAGRLQVKRVVR
jgi:GxxExxY protein